MSAEQSCKHPRLVCVRRSSEGSESSCVWLLCPELVRMRFDSPRLSSTFPRGDVSTLCEGLVSVSRKWRWGLNGVDTSWGRSSCLYKRSWVEEELRQAGQTHTHSRKLYVWAFNVKTHRPGLLKYKNIHIHLHNLWCAASRKCIYNKSLVVSKVGGHEPKGSHWSVSSLS